MLKYRISNAFRSESSRSTATVHSTTSTSPSTSTVVRKAPLKVTADNVVQLVEVCHAAKLFAVYSVALATFCAVSVVLLVPIIYSHSIYTEDLVEEDLIFCVHRIAYMRKSLLQLADAFVVRSRRSPAVRSGEFPTSSKGRPRKKWRSKSNKNSLGHVHHKDTFGDDLDYDERETDYVEQPEPVQASGYKQSTYTSAPPSQTPYSAPAPSCCSCGMGRMGLSGMAGPDGQPGRDGRPGRNGPPGQDADPDQCPRGPPGLRGLPGNKGVNGDPGVRGKDGDSPPPGPPGKPGTRGPRGSPGRVGQTGPTGRPGLLQIVEGPAGEQGPTGEEGAPGPPGTPGPPGHAMPGQPGEKGAPGLPGPDGSPGPTGPPGPKGAKGGSGDCSHCPQPRIPPGY